MSLSPFYTIASGLFSIPEKAPTLKGDLVDDTGTVKDYIATFLQSQFIDRYRTIIVVIYSICLLVSLAMLIIQITRFAKSGSDADARTRKTAMSGMIMSGISIALLGSIGIIVGFFVTFWNSTP